MYQEQINEVINNVNSFIFGNLTLKKCKVILLNKKLNGDNSDIVIDLTKLTVRESMVKDIAKLSVEYGVSILGLKEHETLYNTLIVTNYFTKESMGKSNYSKMMKLLIIESDFPLMILDKRLQHLNEDIITEMFIIQPIAFSSKYFHFKQLKPIYTDISKLSKMKDLEKVWSLEQIHLNELGSQDVSIRFTCNEMERYLLDLIQLTFEGKI